MRTHKSTQQIPLSPRLKAIKDRNRRRNDSFVLVLVQQLEQSRANAGRHSQNNSLRYAVDGVSLSVVSGVEQVIGCLLKLKRKGKVFRLMKTSRRKLSF